MSEIWDSLSFIESFFNFFQNDNFSPYLLWILVIIACIIIELMIGDLLFASLALSGISALIAQFFGLDYIGQTVAFSITAALIVAVLRPLALKKLTIKTKDNVTNVDALIGMQSITTKDTDEKTGEIKLKGEIWTAKTKFGAKKIKSGKYVTILSIDGATAVVQEMEKGENK
jgi:membrane protein implicated in regulation of membrane protease activity